MMATKTQLSQGGAEHLLFLCPLLVRNSLRPRTAGNDSRRRLHRHFQQRARAENVQGDNGLASLSTANSVEVATGIPAASEPSGIAALLQSRAVPDVTMAKQLGLNEEHLQALMELPGTATVSDLKTRLVALSQWQAALRRGFLPSASDIGWPAEPFCSQFIDVLKRLGMPRFTRRYPKLLGSLLRQFLELAKEFEGKLLEQEEENKKKQVQQQQQKLPESMQSQSQQSGSGDSSSSAQDRNSGEGQEGEQSEVQEGETGEASDQADASSSKDVQLQLENIEGGGQATDAEQDDASTESSGFAERLAEDMLKKFEEDWSPMVEGLETASQVFEDIDGLMEGPEGFDLSRAVWHQSGWREVEALRRRLEDLRELRDLVRSLGRGGGKGPLKRAPQQLYKSGNPPGVIRTEQSPEETRGLTRSGDLSRMLPMETHLLAAGWPRRGRDLPEVARTSRGQSTSPVQGNEEASGGSREDGSRACRLLFMARRAERQLMSYERAGWAENEPSRVTGRLELRPAAELGPIIVCLDTSGSMHGAREMIAKALTLECMRGAHRQQRKCYVYAFSGPGDVMELELGVDRESISRLLTFLTMSFSGGTDVDAPLALSLERLGREEWELADILMVTDGEIPLPDEDILACLRAANDNLGLEVHGLLVGSNVTEPMKQLCTHLHVFKSWSAVGKER